MTNPARPDIVPHLARVVVLQPHSLLPGGPASGADPTCEHPASQLGAHLPPLLAYNIGLSYQLAPFLHSGAYGSEARPSLHGMQPGPVSLLGSSIVLQPWREEEPHAGTAARKRSSGPQVARAISIASVRMPSEGLLQDHDDDEAPDVEGASGSSRGRHAERAGQGRDGGKSEKDEAQEGDADSAAADHLVEALKAYFGTMPR